jgi:hypothetical protein
MKGVFVHDFTYVQAPFERVAETLTGSPSLDREAHAAVDEGDRFLAVVGPLGAAPGLSKAVVVSVGQSHQRGDALVVPLLWIATGPRALFPSLEADLEVAAAGPDRTQLSLMGTYDPPGGELGRLVDRFVLHRVAEATIRGFLRELAASLGEQPVTSGASARPATA